MTRTITAIPATKRRYTGQALDQPAIRKVAGYARVSTDHENQVTSYEAQVDYYTRYITDHAGWQLAGIYTDEGITGTSAKHRAGFQNMVADALAGKIDLIITKSVSRFARNTVDSLTTVRTLKDAGVEVFFEKENIWTFDAKGELLITIMSSLAQEEALSISENVTWGHRKRFADGKVTIPYGRFLGYDKGPDGNLVINQAQAVTVRYIYSLYLDGQSLTSIARTLQKEGYQTATGNKHWSASQVRNILTNEKYKGDALLQKSYITDFLTKKQVKNEGEVPQYYVTGNHEPIITPAVWDFVQAELAAPATGRRSSSLQRTFSGKIRCAQCEAWYGSKTWHAGIKYEKRIWRCNHKYAGGTPCATSHVSDEQITAAFLDAVHHLLASRDQVDELVDKAVRAELDTTDLHIEADQLFARVGAAAERIDALIARNARVAQDQSEYQHRFDKLTDEHATLLEKYHRLLDQISDLDNRQAAYHHYREELDKLDADHIEFTPYLWHTLVDHAEVSVDATIIFTFRDGSSRQQMIGK